jgi:hypothetical protein
MTDYKALYEKQLEENKKLKDDAKDSSYYLRCLMDYLHNPDNPDEDYVKEWAEDEGLNKEDTEDLLINFGYGE